MRARLHRARDLRKSALYIGPNGGKWANPEHTVHYQEGGNPRAGKACQVCRGVGHVISRQPSLLGGAETVTSAPCRTCNRSGKIRLDPAKLRMLGLPMPTAPHAQAPTRAPAAPSAQQSLFGDNPAPRAPTPPPAAPKPQGEQRGLFEPRAETAPKAAPIAGQHTIKVAAEIAGGKEHALEVHAAQDANGGVRVASSAQGLENGGGTKMAAPSFRHMKADLEGRVDLPPTSSNEHVNAVVSGKGKLLGKGDDGIAFKVGDQVVKVSTTVPYQPFNPGHRTPKEAIEMLRGQVEVANKLADAGVPGMLRSEFVQHGDKGFQIKPHVEIPAKLTRAQLDKARESVLAMHAKGYALNDDVQVGLEGDRVVLYDTGKAAPAKGEGLFSDQRADLDRIADLYRQHGETAPGREKKSGDRLFWDMAVRSAEKLVAAGDREGAKAKLLKQRETMLNTASKPISRGDLAEWEADAEEKLGITLPPWEKSLVFRTVGLEALEKNLPVKERLVVQGLDVAIENPKGSVRRWYDPAKRTRGQTVMVHPYGFIEGTKGADGDDIDVFVGPYRRSPRAFIVNQRKLDGGGFDEHKVLLGFRTLAEARAAYLANYDAKGPQLLGTIRDWPIRRFKAWLRSGLTSEPASKALR